MMKLDIFAYKIYNHSLSNQWEISDFQLGEINLIVGKNASGKSKIVNAIHAISSLLSEGGNLRNNLTKDEWHLIFNRDNSDQKIDYLLRLDKGLVIEEKLIIGKETLLERNESGEGNIYAQEIKQNMRFQTPPQEIAVVRRRDGIQHPFLESLYQWANSLRFYEFGTELGQYTMVSIPPRIDLLKHQTDAKDADHIVSIFLLGKQEIGQKFVAQVIDDMQQIGYQISEIGSKVPSLINLDIEEDYLPKFLYVKEADLTGITEQSEMSQGMFRALSLLIQINYSLMSSKPSCIIIDDIGEGLDYQRSSVLIKILIDKAKTGLVQLIMTTNDEFIMNGVPLEYWSVIERKSGVVEIHNRFNPTDKIKMDEFEFIGLNNFDFFTSDFHLEKAEMEEE